VEWLEPRLALSHAPLGDFRGAAERDTPNPIAAAFNTPPADVSSHDVRSHDDDGFAGSAGRLRAGDYQLPPSPPIISQGDVPPPVESQAAVASQAYVPPPFENDGPPPIVNASPPSIQGGHDTPITVPSGSVTSVESITVILIENVPATTIVTVENPPVSAPNISAPNNSLGEALAVVALSASEPNTPHVNPPAISIAAAPTEGSNGTVPLASVQFVHSVDAVIRGIEAASPMPVQISSGTELAPMPPLASAPSNHQEFADERGVSPIPISVAANSLAFAAAAHDALMLGVPVNFAAIDRAFGAVRNGIEAMGNDVVGWVDELRASDWRIVVFAGLLAAGSYYCLQQRAAKGTGNSVDDGSSWFLTQWHNSSEQA